MTDLTCYRCNQEYRNTGEEWACGCRDGCCIIHADCRDVLPLLPKVDLVLTDPPYFGVVGDAWDNQWATSGEFLGWADTIIRCLHDRLSESGSLYWFCSPQLLSDLSQVVARMFRVIGSIVWSKGELRKGAAGSGVDVSSLRTFWTANGERCIFAEHKGSDTAAAESSGYWTACETLKKRIFGDYLRGEFTRAGVTNKQVAALFPSKTGGLTGCVSNWLLGANVPTPEQYQEMRLFLNQNGAEYLRTEYEELRTEYEELRTEYEELRRPFFLAETDQWGDVWTFPIERNRQHPTQKPMAMIAQMVRVSSRQSSVILDPFMGSGTTLRAAKDLGRKAIGIEIEEKYCEIAANRLRQEVLF